VLDAWKREYSNNDTRKVAIPWFWQNYDAEGYCMFHAKYKYNSELTQIFMAANLVGGFFQRLDRLRKYGFGSTCLFGKDNDVEIEGVWLFRGKDIPAEMKTCDDSELYDWRRLDHTNAADKELIEDFFAWDGKFGGKERAFNQGKVFK